MPPPSNSAFIFFTAEVFAKRRRGQSADGSIITLRFSASFFADLGGKFIYYRLFTNRLLPSLTLNPVFHSFASTPKNPESGISIKNGKAFRIDFRIRYARKRRAA